jgi:4-hydroxybutyryl-CoA dehydratase/vinylacetyl-CoA-Delta-isomerase
MLNGDQYRESLRDGRAVFMDGERVEDVTTHPLIRVSADWVAATYDRFASEAAMGTSPLFSLPRTPAELQAQMDAMTAIDQASVATAGCMALRRLAPRLDELGTSYGERLNAFLSRCEAEDLRVAVAKLDAGAGSVRVVARTPEGITIRGAKAGVIGGAVVHELLVVPQGAKRTEAGDTAVACAVPVDAPGVKVVAVTTAPRSPDTRHYPVSRERSMTDGVVLFDDVFVPNERVFLCSETQEATAFVDGLGVWERARVVALRAEEAETLLGLAQTIAEMNGVPNVGHIRQKLSTMAVYAGMCKAGWEAALANAETAADGTFVPNEMHVYSTKSYGDDFYNAMVSYLHDISGGLLLTCPSVADFENEATHMYMAKYLRTMPGVSGEDRMKVFHLIRDLTADTYWGWNKIVNQSVAGGMDAQRAAALVNFDLSGAKSQAQAAARLGAS